MTQQTYQITQSYLFDGSIHEQIEKLNPYGAIPADPMNCEYNNYLQWLAAGNVAPIIPPVQQVTPVAINYEAQINALQTAVAALQATAIPIAKAGAL